MASLWDIMYNEMGQMAGDSKVYVYFIVFTGLACRQAYGNVDSMYQVIKGDVELLENAVEDFDIFFSYALPEYRCIQVNNFILIYSFNQNNYIHQHHRECC